jgi:hypothetical protein
VSGRPGSRGSPPRRQPRSGDRGLPRSLTELAGVWPVHLRSLQSLPGRRWRRCPSAGRPYRVQADLLGVFDRAPRLWVRPGGPRHSVGQGHRARPVVPALLRAADLPPAPAMAQPAKKWTVERPARRTGATRRGPRPPGATWGHAQARQADTSQRPGASRSGLLLSPRRGARTPHEHARGPGWFFNRNQKITAGGRPE